MQILPGGYRRRTTWCEVRIATAVDRGSLLAAAMVRLIPVGNEGYNEGSMAGTPAANLCF